MAETGPNGSFASARTNDSISCATPSTRCAATLHTTREASKYTAPAKASTNNASSPPYQAVIRQRKLEKNGSRAALGAECVTDATDRVDEFVVGVDIDFVTEIPNVDVDQVRFAQKVRTPNAVENFVARMHLVRVHEQEFEQREFLRRQFDVPASALHFVRVAVEDEIFCAKHPRAGFVGTQLDADPREQF